MIALATASGMDAITGAIDTVVTVTGKAFDVMTSNPLITFFVAVSVLGAGIGVFKRLKRAA